LVGAGQGLQNKPAWDVLIHRGKMAGFSEHKMGPNLANANVYYKQEWGKGKRKMRKSSWRNKPQLDGS